MRLGNTGPLEDRPINPLWCQESEAESWRIKNGITASSTTWNQSGMGLTLVYTGGKITFGAEQKTTVYKMYMKAPASRVSIWKNISTVGPSYWWGAEPSFSSSEKSEHTNRLKVKQVDCVCGTSLVGWKEFLVSIYGMLSSILKFYVKNMVMIYGIHCVHHTNPQHKVTAALLQVFPLGTQAKCILKGQK